MTSVAERPTGNRGLQVPPHSVEAEESVLGAVLLSSDAANIALEKLHAEDFYRPAHQQVFEAVRTLFDANEPIDAVTVSEMLRREGALERLGGVAFLTRLLDTVPTTSNVDYYAGIVEEHALRRRLMRVGGTIGVIASEMSEPIANVLDRAEQEVFQVAERRVGEGLAAIDPLLGPAIERAEELQRLGSEDHRHPDRLPGSRHQTRWAPPHESRRHRCAPWNGEDGAGAQHRSERRAEGSSGGDLLT